MSKEMGPCPKCRRHVVIAEHRCPFCGATWLMSAAAAVSMLLGTVEAAPVADPPRTAAQAQPEYGVPRDPVDKEIAHRAWRSLFGDWKQQYGFAPSGWRVRDRVVFRVKEGEKTHTLQVAVDRADEKEAAISIVLDDYRVGAKQVSMKPAVPDDATVTKVGTEKVGDVECTITRYEWPGVDVRVWKSGDRVMRVESEQEKSRFVKTEEIEVAKKKIACELWETTRGDVTIREWRSAEVPGGIVRWVSGTRELTLQTLTRVK